jgi:hypothetical protein
MNDQTKVLTASGSSWDRRHLIYFAIHEIQSDEDEYPAQLSKYIKTENLDNEVRKCLQSVSSAQLSSATHGFLMNQGGLFGPFLTFLALVKETRDTADPSSSPERQRDRTIVSRHGFVPSSSIPSADSTPESTRGAPVEPESGSSYQLSDTNTGRSARERRTKPETVTNTMMILFLQATLESSRLSKDDADKDSKTICNLEWHCEPSAFKIAAPQVKCVSINDGSLLRKGFEQKRWTRISPLVYCSVEVRSLSVGVSYCGTWTDSSPFRPKQNFTNGITMA